MSTDKTDSKVEKTVEVDSVVMSEIAKQVTEAVKKDLVVPTADEIAAAMVEKTEKIDKKAIHDDGGQADKPGKVAKTTDSYDKLPAQVKFTRGIIAQLRGDAAGVAQYNEYASKAWAEKANYQNVTTTADGGALVPDPEFIAEVDRLTNEYGVAARLANVRQTDRDSVTLLSGTNEISFVSTSEATAQNAAKLTYDAQTVALVKYIATLVMTSELVEDSAIDIFADAANEIARARAKLFDNLVFTDTTYGLLYAPDAGEGWKTQTVGTAITDLDFDDLLNAQYKVVSAARRNAKYFMHPTVWNYLRQKKSGDGTNSAALYYAGSPLESPTPTIDGVPVELVDVMPAYGEITANEPFAVFGDLGRVYIHVKRLLETKTFDTGVVKDAGGSDINLLTQDAWAIRATLRVVPQTKFPAAFCIIGTGTVS